MNCKHCKEPVQGEAYVGISDVWHIACHKPWIQAQQGRPHRCPQCNGAGGTTTESPRYRREGGYNGFFDKGEEIFEGVDKKFTKCQLCDGHGYLAKAPEPIIEPAKVVGWKR